MECDEDLAYFHASNLKFNDGLADLHTVKLEFQRRAGQGTFIMGFGEEYNVLFHEA